LRAERVRLVPRFDMLNVFNRYQFDDLNPDLMNTNFGTVQQHTAAVGRFLQFQGRIRFCQEVGLSTLARACLIKLLPLAKPAPETPML